MINKRLFSLILFSLIISFNTWAQIQKKSFQFGIGGSALFELNSTGINGALINLHGEYTVSKKFILGVQPYYALTDEKMTYAFDLVRHKPRGIQKDVFRSFGANLEVKFLLSDGIKIKPYTAVLLGAGYSSYRVFHNNMFGEMQSEDHGHFINYNLGFGIGAYFNLTKSWYLDAKFMYTDVTANKNIEASNYFYPSLGIIKSF